MKYLALTENGIIHDVGDYGDWESATLDNWVKIADTILNVTRKDK